MQFRHGGAISGRVSPARRHARLVEARDAVGRWLQTQVLAHYRHGNLWQRHVGAVRFLAACLYLPQQNAKRPHVTLLAVATPTHLLGRHVAQRSHVRFGDAALVHFEFARHAKVGDEHASVLVYEKIARGDVAMNQVIEVQVYDALARVHRHADAMAGREAAASLDQILDERALLGKLGHNRARLERDAHQANDVGVRRQALHERRLRLELLLLFVAQLVIVGFQHFDSHLHATIYIVNTQHPYIHTTRHDATHRRSSVNTMIHNAKRATTQLFASLNLCEINLPFVVCRRVVIIYKKIINISFRFFRV